MKKIPEKIITCFFVLLLGSIWYCSTRRQIKPDSYTIIIHDIFGRESKIDEIRTDFKTKKVAQSYIAEYGERFPQYNFSINLEMPQTERRLNFKKVFRIQR